MKIHVMVFWVMTMGKYVVGHKTFSEGHAASNFVFEGLHLQGEDGGSIVLQNTVSYHITIQCHKPENHDIKVRKAVYEFSHIYMCLYTIHL